MLKKSDCCEKRGDLGLKRVLKKVAREANSVPQRLKPHCKHDACGTAEAVPLSKADFFSIL
jgi:hypothetical protein